MKKKNIVRSFYCTGRKKIEEFVEEISIRQESRRAGESVEYIRFRRWYSNTVHWRANTPQEYFYQFKYIFEVDPFKFFDQDIRVKGWRPVKEYEQYTYPNRDFDNCAIYSFFRVLEDRWNGKLIINEIGGHDRLFVATNNSRDATMIALKFS